MNITKQSILATMLLTAGEVQGKRHLDDKVNRHHLELADPNEEYTAVTGEMHSPLVEGTDCVPMCLFRDNKNSFCWKFQSPMLTAGWDFKQTSGTNYW